MNQLENLFKFYSQVKKTKSFVFSAALLGGVVVIFNYCFYHYYLRFRIPFITDLDSFEFDFLGYFLNITTCMIFYIFSCVSKLARTRKA